MFVNRQWEIDNIVTRIKFQTQCSAISGDYGSGKTTLLKHLADPLTKKKYMIPQDQFVLLYFSCPDLTIRPGYTPKEFWQDIFRQLSLTITTEELKSIAESLIKSTTFDYYLVESFFYEAKRIQELSIVLLLDDFDNLLANPHFNEEFLWSLKNLANNHIDYNFGMVTATLPRLSQLCYNPRLLTSPFFSIFSNIDLGPLAENDGLALITFYQEQSKLSENFDTISRMKLFQISGGIPLILKQLCLHFQNAETIQDFLDERLQPQWDNAAKSVLENFVFTFWKNSDKTEKKFLIYLAILFFQRNLKRLDYDGIESLKNEFKNDWSSLSRRGWIYQDELISYLFPQIFIDIIFTEVFEDPLKVKSVQNLVLKTKSDLSKFKNEFKSSYQELA